MEGEELGRRLIAEMRTEGGGLADDSATQLLRFGAEDVGDETVWAAVMTAVHLAVEESELWMLADGVIDESIATRPVLNARWKDAYRTDEAVRAVHRAMWADIDHMAEVDGVGVDYGWWSVDDP